MAINIVDAFPIYVDQFSITVGYVEDYGSTHGIHTIAYTDKVQKIIGRISLSHSKSYGLLLKWKKKNIWQKACFSVVGNSSCCLGDHCVRDCCRITYQRVKASLTVFLLIISPHSDMLREHAVYCIAFTYKEPEGIPSDSVYPLNSIFRR